MASPATPSRPSWPAKAKAPSFPDFPWSWKNPPNENELDIMTKKPRKKDEDLISSWAMVRYLVVGRGSVRQSYYSRAYSLESLSVSNSQRRE